MVQNENGNIQILTLNANPLQEEQDSLQILDARVSNTFTLDLCMMPNLQRLFLINYKIEEVHISDNCINDSRMNDDHPHSLRFLYLDRNSIGDVTFLRKLPRLERLSLSHNKVQTVDWGHSDQHNRLQYISLSRNQLQILENFTQLDVLSHINVSYNQIRMVKKYAFQGSTNLTHLDIRGNYLMMIPDLSSFPRLFYLDLSGNLLERNPIHQLPSEYFTNLAYLHLSHSNPMTLSYSLTVKSTSLLVLSMTNIPMFHKFSENITFDLPTLDILFLSDNGIINLPKITAPDLDSLVLSNNEIKFLIQEVFQGIPRIRYIDLSSNHIRSIPPDTFASSIYIGELNLENNQIHHISESAFINQRGGFILRLGNNHLVSILPSSLPVLSRTVYLDPNPWNCDCESTSIKRWLLLSGVNLYQCMNPLYLRNMSLVSLNETDLCHDEYGDFKSTVTQTSLSMSSGVNRILCSYCLKLTWALLLSSYLYL
ncbi:phospholipase A2 inhibitor-like [Lytechinus variegatus]|uniref:phospholipase A2 inhibitor-like n=1 Tax=Lytechinus variegatus TaxID=7654 RepID=UPI001BB0FA76|nr:phospholipase A2 inhibitor-like [Lytechinus variegatus]